jgi:hypothetical protein
VQQGTVLYSTSIFRPRDLFKRSLAVKLFQPKVPSNLIAKLEGVKSRPSASVALGEGYESESESESGSAESL